VRRLARERAMSSRSCGFTDVVLSTKQLHARSSSMRIRLSSSGRPVTLREDWMTVSSEVATSLEGVGLLDRAVCSGHTERGGREDVAAAVVRVARHVDAAREAASVVFSSPRKLARRPSTQ
jgi:hypothetical protein